MAPLPVSLLNDIYAETAAWIEQHIEGVDRKLSAEDGLRKSSSLAGSGY